MSERRSGRPTGVLFDIDETLVDLRTAMGITLREISAKDLAHFTEEDWAAYQHLYAADPQGYYDKYLAGELSFTRQRLLRVAHAQAAHGLPAFDEDAEGAWNTAYDRILPQHFQAFDDVVPVLDELDALGIPYGAVSNNVHGYQRAKLDAAGLERIQVLVGIDAVDAAKPDPAIFLEGVRLLGTDPAQTLYVGDNPVVDGLGALNAGLQSLWVERSGNEQLRSAYPGLPVAGHLFPVTAMVSGEEPGPFCTTPGTRV
ncbi:HAD family hydrolase [Arthrobacter gandavensis]|uniref:HAD family hydrolase n=1 Tax=Arthrobacter gandavensis TaxID=169960 RepID=UPI00188FE7E2|nr:HAD family hydrolase [Arthrobacter gandavensis]MBF4995526.1 HAD family hydrolase [Arthrobacter gandavensis]